MIQERKITITINENIIVESENCTIVDKIGILTIALELAKQEINVPPKD